MARLNQKARRYWAAVKKRRAAVIDIQADPKVRNIVARAAAAHPLLALGRRVDTINNSTSWPKSESDIRGKGSMKWGMGDKREKAHKAGKGRSIK
tara:strand:- start:1359 stop:1643 length:285 start_codon:yes stop_codon:yes gene_type:complete